MRSDLDEWVSEAGAALGLDPSAVDLTLLLDLARDVAHGVARPAAPMTAFLVGLAAGGNGGDAAAVRAAVETVRRRLAGWASVSPPA
jgi:Domain of unknown function (DUF6457)